MLQSHFYPFHIQDQAPKYLFCSCLTIHNQPHSIHLKTNSDNDKWTVHSQLAYQVLYAAQHIRWHQVKTSEITIWVLPSPSLYPDPEPVKPRRGLESGVWSWRKLLGLAQQMGKGMASLLHNLNDIFVLQCMVFTHFLRIVFHRETPHQSTVWKEKKNIHCK